MGTVSLMTHREMRKHIEHLELVPTLGLKEYKYFYFAFVNDSEFEDEVYNPFDSDSGSDTVASS